MATDTFISIPYRRVVGGDLMSSTITVGASSTATDFFEFRWQSDTGSGATGVTKQDTVNFLNLCIRFINSGGKIGDGTGVPVT